MRDFVLKYAVRMQVFRDLLKEEDGQDMVEYALVMGLIALGATVAINGLAATIGTAFTGVSTKVSSYTS
jgi:pilus assembly protein Flp/PilA